jgi:hypothetical protein
MAYHETQELTTADVAAAARGRQQTDEPVSEDRELSGSNPEVQYSGPLLRQDYSDDLRRHWDAIQTGFIDDPRGSVKEADSLVAKAIQHLAESFSEQRAKLEHDWSKGNEVSTEDLRQAIRQYRAFFNRLLAI